MTKKKMIKIEIEVSETELFSAFKEAVKYIGCKSVKIKKEDFIKYLQEDVQDDFRVQLEEFFIEGLNQDCYQDFYKY